MAGWQDLPQELKVIVFRQLVDGAAAEGTKIGPYATVCTEWRDAIEESTFRFISLSDLISISSFGEHFRDCPRRQALLRSLELKVRLPSYPARLNRVPETEDELDVNDSLFSNAVWSLFSVLRSWDAHRLARDYRAYRTFGLELEVMVYSPSDNPLLYGDDGFNENSESRFFASQVDIDLAELPEPYGRFGLPEVGVISRFVCLRNTRRYISSRTFLYILNSLPRVNHVDIEPWLQSSAEAQRGVDLDFAASIVSWPPTIKRITLFRHSDCFNMNEDVWGPDAKCPMLARNIASLSMGLEWLSVSFMIEAHHFFEQFFAPGRPLGLQSWDHLQYMVLTSSLICSGQDPELLEQMLYSAGLAAKRMPVLRTMELYNAEPGEAGYFRYEISETAASIEWNSVWEYTIPDRVQLVWRAVAQQSQFRRDLAVVHGSGIRDYGGESLFIHTYLKLLGIVLHPRSSENMTGSADYPTNFSVSRPTLLDSRRDREIKAVSQKIEFYSTELQRLQALDPDAYEIDQIEEVEIPMIPPNTTRRPRLGPTSRSAKIEVLYADGEPMQLSGDDDDDGWETE